MKQSFNTHSSNKSPGPSTTADVQKANDNSKNGSLDRQVAISLKKAAKDVTTTEGRLNIISQIDSTKDVLCCKYSENYDYLAAGYTDGIIRIYNASTGEPTFTLSDADVQNKRAPVTCIQHRPVSKSYPMTNSFIGSYANGCVKCWSYHFNQCLYTIQEKRQTFGVTYHPRFPKFVTYGDDSKLYFYDEETQTQERVLMASFPVKPGINTTAICQEFLQLAFTLETTTN